MPLRPLLLALLGVLAVAGAGPARAQYFRYGQNRIPPERHRWQFLQSEHFDVYFYRGGEALAQTAADHAEAALVGIEPLVGHRLEARVPILVYTGAGAFAATDAVPLPSDVEGIGGVTERYKNRVILPFAGDRREFARVLTHELVHAVLNDFFRSNSLVRLLRAGPRAELPLWMNEGLAEYAALGYDAASDRHVRAALLAGRLPDADRLRGYLAYKGGQSFWAFVAAEYGRERIAEILGAFRETRSLDAAFGAATGLGIADLSARWHEALQDVTFPEVAFRERLAETARPVRFDGLGGFVAAPAIAPQGDRVAFVATGGGRLGVYVARLSDGGGLVRLLEARASPALERLRLTPGALAWSPDGRRIAVAATAGRADAVVVVDVATGLTNALRIPGADAVLAVAWSPDGRTIAAEATRRGRSDLFALDVRSGRAEPLTADAASDHAPAWSPDGASLVFHSDRGARAPRDPSGGPRPDGDDGRRGRAAADTLQFDLYRLQLATRRVERLTATPHDELHAAFGADTSAVLYVSDANGVANLHALDLGTGRARPLTDLVVGLDGISVTPDGERAVVSGLEGDRPLVHLVRTPFERRVPGDTLAPTVFARPSGSPVQAFASAGRVARSPFLRRGAQSAPDTSALAGLDPLAPDSAFAFPPLDTAAVAALIDSLDAATPAGGPDGDGGVNGRIDPRPARLRYGPESRTADGAYRARPYRLFFSADVVSGTAGYDALYGAQALAQIQASDVLGGHVFTLQSNLLLDLRNSDYLVGYAYRPLRADVSLQAFHLARLVPEGGLRDRLARYRQYGVTAGVAYPVTTFDRVDAALSLLTVAQASVFDPGEPPVSRTLLNPVLSITHDASAGGPFAPTSGARVAASVSGSPAALRGSGARFATFLADARAYVPFGAGGAYSLALRASGAASVGPNPQRFYAAGVTGWLDPAVSAGGFPILRVEDFAFATPVLPLRGYSLGARSGAYFGLVNAEVRFPLAAVLAPRPFPVLPLQGVAFVDAGALWGGPGGDRRLTLVTGGRGAEPRRLDDLLVGAGVGARVLVFGFPVRFDAAFPFDGARFRRVQPYLSVGADF